MITHLLTRVRAFGLAALATTLIGLPAAAQVEDITDYGTARGWDVMALSYDGQFARCAGVSPDFPFTLELSVEGWTLTVDGPLDNPPEISGYVDVDRASFEGTFYPQANGRYAMFLEDGLVESIRAGRRLAVDLNGSVTAANLSGSTAAMLKIEECVQRQGRAGAATGGAPKPKVAKKAAPVEDDASNMGADCPAYGTDPSPASSEPAQVEFINRSDIAVSIYWLDFNGAPVEYAGLLPGESVTLDTFAGHLWLAKDFNMVCHGGVWPAGSGFVSYEIF